MRHKSPDRTTKAERPTRASVSESQIDHLAAMQHGVVTLEQLRGIGLTWKQVDTRVRKGRLLRLHQGVYGVGPASSAWHFEMAAVLACGPGAVLSHRSAAVLWGMLPAIGDEGIGRVGWSRGRGAKGQAHGARGNGTRNQAHGAPGNGTTNQAHGSRRNGTTNQAHGSRRNGPHGPANDTRRKGGREGAGWHGVNGPEARPGVVGISAPPARVRVQGMAEARGRGSGGPPQVTVQASNRGATARGIAAFRTRHLPDEDRTIREGIPVTTPARTILDLAAVAARGGGSGRSGPGHRRTHPTPVSIVALEQAIALADREGLVTLTEMRARLASAFRRPGSRLLREILDLEGGPAFTRSEAERILLELIRRSDLPRPEVNARAGHYEVDFLWPGLRLGVEVDGYAFHGSRDRFEKDRARDADLAAAGIQVIRFTWRQIHGRPEAVLVRLVQAIEHARTRSPAPHRI